MKKQGYRVRVGLFGPETIICEDCIGDLKKVASESPLKGDIWKIAPTSNWTGELECLKCKCKIKHKVVI
jgi:hypothetical protein